MKVSIITATYNSAQTINNCMDSVLGQTYKNIEYVVIDGNSKDRTVEIIKARAAEHLNIKWVSEADKGIYDALNKGIEMATGEIIGFVHSDDYLAGPEIISEIVKIFEEGDTDGVYGDLEYVNKEDTMRVIRSWKSRNFHPKLLKKGWMPAHPTLFLKKEVYQKHGSFDLKFKIAADYDFMLRVLRDPSLKFSYVPKVITKMRVGGASNRSLKNMYQKSREDFTVIKSNGIPFPIRVLLFKNFSKIPQFFKLLEKF
ncbi:glycosyltransferase family 2 protein [Aequorivita lipolytica]|uniref:Glycosyltransferase n=1 Tax=Aequorivita lipolytica TaxID=153267 RepID=A0A5C6YM01_9FLAO|nr:glycosyltransferase family 2 protein [Aequorivita lipolytica]TXD68585.1 glycosyltransferase [Aequorivita lipolytica]SRX53264.1 PGL/p-HBAD biosynthesis glycosyltransferase [Aequorivita lipolytica]